VGIEKIIKQRKIRHKGWKRPLPWINRYICMKISPYITKILIHTPVTSNQVTMVMLFLGILGPIFLFNGHFIIGLLLLFITAILDDVDGELASYRKKFSLLGKYIDGVYHTVANPLMLFGFAYGIYNIHPNNLLIIFGFLSAIFAQSVVVPTIFDTIISTKIRNEPIPKISKKITGKEILEYEGQSEEYKNNLIKIYHNLRLLWAFPDNIAMLTLIYIWEVLNLKYGFLPKFLVSIIFFVIYGSWMALNQILSFTFHTKNNSIDSYYVFLFGKK